MNAIKIRSVEEQEIDHLARLWYEGWQDAHAQIVPAELRRLRSLDSFKHRLQSALRDTRVVGPLGRPLGFCTTKGNELYQIYVSAEARGTGVAAALMTDAETRLSRRAVSTLHGWRTPSGMTELHGFMKSLVGVASVSSLTRQKQQPELFR